MFSRYLDYSIYVKDFDILAKSVIKTLTSDAKGF